MKNKNKQWFENEEFWQRFAPIMFDASRWAEAPTVADYVIKIANLKKGSSILDAGCGTGRICIELAAKNMNVTGVDIIQSELDAAKESAADEGVELNLINKDLRIFKTSRKFDCGINLYTSFGYCDTIKEDFLIIKNICKALKKGATFIMECISRETAILYFTEGEEFERAGFNVVTKFTVEGNWEGLRSNWTLINDKGEKYTHEFIQRLYSAVELKQLILKAGFSSAKVFGDFDFSPYNQKARTMIIIAKK